MTKSRDSKKPPHEKNYLEMDFNEFVTAATYEVMRSIAEGKPLRSAIWNIADHAIRNEVFGRGADHD